MGNKPKPSLPTYQNLFGSDSYYTVPDHRSVLSPAAYLVDLFKLVETNITVGTGGTDLKTRRPDIYSLPLDKINTDNELSKLEIVIQILQNQLGKNIDLSTATYPFNLPYDSNLQEVRQYLAQNNTSLRDIWKNLNSTLNATPPQSVFLETTSISAQQWKQYSTPVTKGNLYKYYGYSKKTTDAQVKIDLSTTSAFLARTGLNQSQLHELVYEDLSENEIADTAKNYQGHFYINSGSTTPVSIQGQTLTNLSVENVGKIMRFVRLAQAIGWSFTDLDWALCTIGKLVNSANKGAPVINNDVLPYLAWIQEQVKKNGLTVNQCCGFLGQIKDFGDKNGPDFYESIFENPANPQLPPVPSGKTDLVWTVRSTTLDDRTSKQSKQIESALAAALQVNQDDLLALVAPIIKYNNNKKYALSLTPEILGLLYRMSLLPRILGKSVKDIFVAAEILEQKNENAGLEKSLVSTTHLHASTLHAVSELQTLFSWLASSPLSLGQLEFITLGKSRDSNIQNGIIGTDTAQNFINQLQSALQKERLTENVLYAAIYNDILQLFNSLVLSELFQNPITPTGVQTVPDTVEELLQNAAEDCKEIITAIYNELPEMNILSSQGIVTHNFNDTSNLKNKKIIEDAIRNALDSSKPFKPGKISHKLFIKSKSGPSSIVITQLSHLIDSLLNLLHNTYHSQEKTLINLLSGLYHTTPAIAKVLKKWADLNSEKICAALPHPRTLNPIYYLRFIRKTQIWRSTQLMKSP